MRFGLFRSASVPDSAADLSAAASSIDASPQKSSAPAQLIATPPLKTAPPPNAAAPGQQSSAPAAASAAPGQKRASAKRKPAAAGKTGLGKTGAGKTGAGKKKAVKSTIRTCPQCGKSGSWGLASWCPNCGHYPKLGDECELDLSPPVAPQSGFASTYPGVLLALPMWVHVLYAGVLAIFAANVAAALILPLEGPHRRICTLVEATLGIVLVGATHAIVFILTIPNTDRYGPFDFILHPIEVWRPTLNRLPAQAWRVWFVAWGMTAALCATLLVGGVRYSTLLNDWGFTKRAKPDVVQEVLAQARAAKDEVASLEGSLSDFVKKAAAEPEDDLDKLPNADCLIFGYTKSAQDVFSSVLLASLVDGRLVYVATLSASELSEDARGLLRDRLPKLDQKKTIVQTTQSATWLKPVLLCRVAYKGHTKAGTFKDVHFLEMLNDIRAEDTSGASGDDTNAGQPANRKAPEPPAGK